MSFKNKGLGLALLGVLLALASCRDLALDPVFYTLSKEQPLGANRGFPDVASVFKIVKFTAGTDYYLVAAGKMYIRGTGESDNWTVVDPPTGLANAMCNTLEVLGTTIYAGFYDSANGTGYGLYTSPLTVPLSWTLSTDPNAQNVEITLLKAVGGQLFVGTNLNSGNVNALYYGNGGSSTAVTWSSAPNADLGFIDVAQDSSVGNYWIIVGPYLYRSTAALPGAFAVYDSVTMNPPGDADAPAYPLSTVGTQSSGGLLDDGTALYVSGGNGFLYRTADGGTSWTRNPTVIRDDNDDPVHFTAFTALSAASDTGAIYAGTGGQGYYRIPDGDVTGVAGTLTREPSYNITSLYAGALYCLFYDPAPPPPIPPCLFLGTANGGLWRGEFATPGAWTWRQE